MGFTNKPNSGVSKKDLRRGFTDGEVKKDSDDEICSMFGEDKYIGNEDPGEFKGGFLGRPKGWER